ncbi:single-stranded DNA-binding protein [Leucobacter sp. UCD-THU]|nr:single-stranded DNA-binding protein [Leucobacter sp. UCD-THU]
MEIRSEPSIRGFLSRAPEQKSKPGEVFLLVAQIGQKFRRREDDGTFTQVGSAYIDLIMIGDKAEEAFADFVKGDDVVAIGEFTKRQYEQDGQRIERPQFRASRLLLDTSRARYTVERTPRQLAPKTLTAAEVTAVEFRSPEPRRASGLGRSTR